MENFKLHILSILFCFCLFNKGFAQQDKYKLRLNVNYIKEMNHARYLEFKSFYKVHKKRYFADKTKLLVYQYTNDTLEKLIGKVTLNKKGKAKLKLPEYLHLNLLKYIIKLGDNKKFKPINKRISIKDALLDVYVNKEKKDNYLYAVLTDTKSGSPIKGKALKAQVKRSFKNLNLGNKEQYLTDTQGQIKVKIPKDIPTINKGLTLNIILDDDDVYGTIKTFIVVPLGKPIVENNSFDERKLWSSRGKAPFFLFFISISLFVIIWTNLVNVVYKIYKIYKD
jgi:hypothetical protein